MFEDALHKFKCGLQLDKNIQITFVGEPAVDTGDPLREFLYLLLSSISRNNSLFCGDETSRVPTHNIVELEKRTYYHVGKMIAVSLIRGGPAPRFFASAVADYIVYGVQKVKPCIEDIPDHLVKEKMIKVQHTTLYNYRL